MKHILFATMLALAAGPAAAVEESTIAIENFVFSPATLTVKAGAKVVFVNHDDLPHSVVGAKGAFRSNALDTDESFARVFDRPGEIVYFCGLHPQMQGRIIVTP
jgi:plastocyanin